MQLTRNRCFLCRWPTFGADLFLVTTDATLETSEAVDLIVYLFAPVIQIYLPPAFLVIWTVYLMLSILRGLISNNAFAVVVTPVAICLANALDFDAPTFGRGAYVCHFSIIRNT